MKDAGKTPLDELLAELGAHLGGAPGLLEGLSNLAGVETHVVADGEPLPCGGTDPSFRPCLYIFEPHEARRGQCRHRAEFVCMNADGLQWFACQVHGDSHAHVRMTLAEFFELVFRGVSSLPAESWSTSPGAAPRLN